MARFRETGLRPVVDLLHYGTPLWLDGQFAHPDYPAHVTDYAARFAARYGDVATDYTPVNEPVIHALFSGEYGYWPPYLTGAEGSARIASALAKGFVSTQHAIARELGDAATFVHVDAGIRYVGDVDAPEHRDTVARLRAQTFLVEDLVTGGVDDAHPLVGRLRSGGVTDADLDWFRQHAVRPDVMGVNYYPLHSTEVFEAGVHHGGGFADPRPYEDTGVEGLRDVLTTYAERYGAPVMLTETCVTGSVEERIGWLDASVTAVREPPRRGAAGRRLHLVAAVRHVRVDLAAHGSPTPGAPAHDGPLRPRRGRRRRPRPSPQPGRRRVRRALATGTGRGSGPVRDHLRDWRRGSGRSRASSPSRCRVSGRDRLSRPVTQRRAVFGGGVLGDRDDLVEPPPDGLEPRPAAR